MPLTIKTEELKSLFHLIIKKLEKDSIEEVSIDMDYYQIIQTGEWSPEIEIKEFAVGSLYDDWESLKKVLDKKNELTYVDFDRTASILRAISETNAPTK